MTKGATKSMLVLMTGAAFAGIGGYAWMQSGRPAVLEIFVLDLAGKMSILIRTPNDKRILMNGGSNSSVIRSVTDLLPFYSRRIDKIVATDFESKNTSGLIDILNRYKVENVVIPSSAGNVLKDSIYETFSSTILEKGIGVKEVSTGDEIDLDEGLVAKVLFPAGAEFEYSKASSPEIVLSINHGDNSILFLGSVSPKIQKFVSAQADNADVLVVSHGATPTNMAKEILSAVKPEWLVYSKQLRKASETKKKPKIDPLAQILDSHRLNVREHGVIKIVSNGKELKIEKAP